MQQPSERRPEKRASSTTPKDKPSYSPRSRSPDRSRSKERKEKKHKHKQHKHRSKSKEKKRYQRSRSRDKDRDRDRKKKHKHERQRRPYEDRRQPPSRPQAQQKSELLPTQIPMPLEVSMPPIPGQRRERKRSRSPLNYYRRHQNSTNDGEFWDSFTWVPRMNYTQVSVSALATTKKMRRLMITNIPYELGISQDDLKNLITRYMTQNYLKDNMNNCPVVDLQIDQIDRSAAVQLSSVEQTCRVCKLQKIELFKGIVNGIIRLGQSFYGSNVVAQAQTAAQAQAAAFAAINVLENKKTQFSVDTLKNTAKKNSTLLRIVNAVTPYMANNLSKQQWQEYQQDLLEGFSQFGTVVHHWLVTKQEKDICADAGNLFVQYQAKVQAEKAMEEMQGRMYDQRAITLYYIPREIYYENFKKGMTPPAILDKK